MRKIIFMLSLVALMVAMAVPVFASTEIAVAPRDTLLDLTERTVTINWASRTSSGNSIQLINTNTERRLQFNTQSGYTTISYNKDGTIQAGHGSTQFATNLILDSSDDDYEWLINNWFYAKVCDGSTCPATDVNKDNICDDCGMMFAVLRDYTPDNWPSAYPSPPVNYETMVLLTTDGVTYLYSVDGPASVTVSHVEWTTKNRTLSFSNMGLETVQRYQLIGDTWAYDSVNSLREFTFDNETLSFNYSSVPIYDVDGNLFFPHPLWVEMDKVTQGEMGALTREVGGTIHILILCGVGLMACLVAYVLFGKVLRIFHR